MKLTGPARDDDLLLKASSNAKYSLGPILGNWGRWYLLRIRFARVSDETIHIFRAVWLIAFAGRRNLSCKWRGRRRGARCLTSMDFDTDRCDGRRIRLGISGCGGDL